MTRRELLLVGLLGAVIMATRSHWKIPNRAAKYMPLFEAAALQHRVPMKLLVRVAQQESNFDPQARSDAGAIGIMQIIPYWHPDVDGDPARHSTMDEAAALDPVRAIPYGASFLRENFDRFGSWGKALAAYNWGPTALAKAINKHGETGWLANAPDETRHYVQTITRDTGLA